MKRILWCLLMATHLTSCAPGEYGALINRPPQDFVNYQNISGMMIGAEIVVDQVAAERHVGFDILGYGIVPVQVVIVNRSGQEIEVVADRTFLAARGGERWKMLQTSDALLKVGWDIKGKEKGKDMDPGSPAGMLLEHIISPLPPPGKLLKREIEGKSIPSGGMASGCMYFPGEAAAARELRLQIRFRDSGRRENLVMRLK